MTLPLVIFNPQSQGGKTRSQKDAIMGVLERAVGPIDLALTERPRHATELAANARKEGRESVIAVGGDGTLHEVVNGLMQDADLDAASDTTSSGPTLGIIGQGTGGDFRKSLGLEHRLEHYAQTIAAGKTRQIDVGRFSYHDDADTQQQAFFLNILSIGLGGLVDRYVAGSSRRLGGTAAYMLASARALLNSEIALLDCVIENDGETETRQFPSRSVAICNGQYFGGGMQVAPMAELDDGKFNVVSLGAAPKLRFALESLAIYKGEHIKHDSVTHFACDKVTFKLRNPSIRSSFPLDVDGEAMGSLPLTIEVLKRRLSVFAPAT